jgi:hypothetical protein
MAFLGLYLKCLDSVKFDHWRNSMRLFILFALLCTSLSATLPNRMNFSDEPKIGVQNAILAKVNGNTISMMDVKKKMDVIFYQHYSHLADSAQARCQFYETSWRRMLMEMIDHELILADAADKEVKLTDAEVREEIENRFGPNVMSTLDTIGISYDEAWKMIKNEIIVTRMTWWFIQSKAMAKVTPQEIRQGYRLYLKENPARTEWKYRVLSLRETDPATIEELHRKIQEQAIAIEEFPAFLKEFEAAHPSCNVSLSNEYSASDAELSDSHRTSLYQLTPGSFGPPVTQTSRDKKKLTRIFYLAEKTDIPAPTFEQLASQIKNELIQKHSIEISELYLQKLRKHYRFDAEHLQEMLPADLQPFALQ